VERGRGTRRSVVGASGAGKNAGCEPYPASAVGEPTFTVVMPAYNAEETIGAAIDSLFAQTRGDWELVVVDNGSTDDTLATAGRYQTDERVRVLQHPDRGISDVRNAGIEGGRAPLVGMLDSDDLWLPGYLERMAAALKADPEAGFAYTDAWILEDGTRRIHHASAMAYQQPPEPPPPDAQALLGELVQRNFVFTSATVRRRVLDEVGGYRSNLEAAEDYELWLRIAAHGYRAARVPGRLAVYRRRPGSLSRDLALMARSVREVMQLVADEFDVPEPVREAALARARHFDRSLTPDGQSLRVRARLHERLVELRFALLDRRHGRDPWPPELEAAFPELKPPDPDGAAA
jgi:glycosyltransferase involved in cell wall biosynthesis